MTSWTVLIRVDYTFPVFLNVSNYPLVICGHVVPVLFSTIMPIDDPFRQGELLLSDKQLILHNKHNHSRQRDTG